METNDPVPPESRDAFQRVAGHAWFTPTGETGMIDLGDIVAHRLTADAQRKPVLRSRIFGLIVEREDVISIGYQYRLDCQSVTLPNLELIFTGVAVRDWEQPGIVSGVKTLASIQRGRSYDLQVQLVTACDVVSGAFAAEPALDYTLQAEDGLLQIPWNSRLRNGETITVTYNADPCRMNQVVNLSAAASLQRTGRMQLREWDGERLTRNIIDFHCTLSIDSAPEYAVGAFSSFSLRAHVTGQFQIRTRAAAELSIAPGGVTTAAGGPVSSLAGIRGEPGSIISTR